MSLSPALLEVFRAECREALGNGASPSSLGRDLAALFSGLPLRDARSLAARVIDLAEEFLVRTDAALSGAVPAAPTDPEPAAPAAAAPTEEPALADAVADPAPESDPAAVAA